jgi:hypothetical protein
MKLKKKISSINYNQKNKNLIKFNKQIAIFSCFFFLLQWPSWVYRRREGGREKLAADVPSRHAREHAPHRCDEGGEAH